MSTRKKTQMAIDVSASTFGVSGRLEGGREDGREGGREGRFSLEAVSGLGCFLFLAELYIVSIVALCPFYKGFYVGSNSW